MRPASRDDACVARLALCRFASLSSAVNVAWLFVAVACVAAADLSGPGVFPTISATPPATPQATCNVPARSYPAIAGLQTVSGIETPAATTGGQTLPEGTPADRQTAAAMETVVRAWLACQNAGEPLRAWSLFSDGYLYRLLWREGAMDSDAYAALATPSPAADEAELLEIAGHRVLPDGRYGATVTIAYPSVPMPKEFFFYFTRIDDRLLIDGILGEISFSVP